MPDETYRMYREACWHLSIKFDEDLYKEFLESEEFKQLEVRLSAEAYYTARNWIEAEAK